MAVSRDPAARPEPPSSAPALSAGRAVTRVAELVESGLASAADAPDLARVVERFALRITPAMASLLDPADPDAGIARQFVPDAAELEFAPGEIADPIGDDVHSPVPGLVHRYPDRVLLKPTHACAVYCRFCFRREVVGQGEPGLDPAGLAAALDHVRRHPAIREVILSGGDPLVLSDRRLGAILDGLEAIPHVDVVRFHTRVPVVDPARITDAFASLLDRRFAVWFVLHVNVASELTEDARSALRRLSRAGVPLLAQTVLLKGVNDEAAALEALFRALVAARVKPYYLHHLDPARGTGRFRTGITEGQALMRDLRGRVSGLCQPTYVLDIPGGHGKVPIGPGHLEPDPGEPGGWIVTDPQGRRHRHPDR